MAWFVSESHSCSLRMALQVDALTPSQPYGAPSDGVSTPPSGVGGTPIPHALSMSPGTFQSAFYQPSTTPASPTTSVTESSSSMARTSSVKGKEKEKNLYPSRVIISSQSFATYH